MSGTPSSHASPVADTGCDNCRPLALGPLALPLLFREVMVARTLRRLIPVVLFAAALAVPAGVRAEISDQDLAERIATSVQTYSQFTIFDDVNINVNARVVTLTGWVTIPLKREEIGNRVAKIDGVRNLVNNIQVLPLSPMDSALRNRIAQAIYNNSAFWRYAAMALPSIHVIVNGGHVTLTGFVYSEVERNLAYALAQVPGAFEVRNEIKLDRQGNR